MADKEYYRQWLLIKEELNSLFTEDKRIQELANIPIGIKPQGTAVEIVARVYCKYCDLYNRLCDCYDQMGQAQRHAYIKTVIDAVTCRLLELKSILEEVEAFEFTYPENALQQMIMTPQNIKILCPFFYPFEIRQKEMQYIVDEILAGNRIGDPTPTASEIALREEQLQEEERIKREEKEAEMKRRLAMGEDLSISEASVVLSPKELEELRLKEEYERNINNIQRMERSRFVTREKAHKRNKDENLYLELAGLKAPQAREELRIKATKLIQLTYRRFMEVKRRNLRENKLKEKLGLIIPSWSPPSAAFQLEKVKEKRRNFRRMYHEKWVNESMKENTRVMRLREGDIMEDITDEIKQWLWEWYKAVKIFDEFPYPGEGGSILIVQGRTFTIEEYIEWRIAEDKRLKAEAGAPKSKEQIKAEKQFEREEKKRLAAEAIEKEKKRLLDYKKSRLKPENDPGIYLPVGKTLNSVDDTWMKYENQWQRFDNPDAPLEVIRGHIMELITENSYQNAQLQLRPIVDEMLKLELKVLQNALKADYQAGGVDKPPQSQKRKKPRKPRVPKPDKIPPARMFQELVDEGIVKKYPRTLLDDYWGDLNYAAADLRAILWTPKFPPHCIGDVREQVRQKCMLTLGCSCKDAVRTQLLVGPKGTGKRTLIYAVATETNSIILDLSPMNVYNKYPGPKNLKRLFLLVNRISKLMQPTVILVEHADKLFYKKVPKEEKMFDPTRLQKDFFKQIVKPILFDDKIMVLGTAEEPWLSKGAVMSKVFPATILIPRTDYGSLSFILTKSLMKYHQIDRDFNLQTVAQVLRGYDINSIRKALSSLLNEERLAQLYSKPLKPMELLSAILEYEGTTFFSQDDSQLYNEWYLSYSPWGTKYTDYMFMLESQYTYKLKADKKKG